MHEVFNMKPECAVEIVEWLRGKGLPAVIYDLEMHVEIRDYSRFKDEQSEDDELLDLWREWHGIDKEAFDTLKMRIDESELIDMENEAMEKMLENDADTMKRFDNGHYGYVVAVIRNQSEMKMVA